MTWRCSAPAHLPWLPLYPCFVPGAFAAAAASDRIRLETEQSVRDSQPVADTAVPAIRSIPVRGEEDRVLGP